jgi:ferrochelatase
VRVALLAWLAVAACNTSTAPPAPSNPARFAGVAAAIARGDAPLTTSVVVQRGDPYAELVEASRARLAAAVGQPVELCYQSQGADGGDWLGPGVRETLAKLVADGKKRVTWSPFGFVADHVETLYDLDIEARAIAKELGVELTRVPALNLHPGLTAALSAVAIRAVSS